MAKNKKGKNRNYKKTENKPVEELSPALKTVQLILKHHIILWLLLFPPIAFYRLFKHKIVNKWIGISLIAMMLALVFVITYSAFNPTLIVDDSIEKYMSNSGYGKVREIDHLGTFDKYNVSEVITTTGYYTVYFEYSSTEGIDVVTIVEYETELVSDVIVNGFNTIYQSENSNPLITELNPALIKFIVKHNDYGNIQSVDETGVGYQIVTTDKGQYTFYFKYYETISIQKWNQDADQWQDVMNRDYIVTMRPEFTDALNREDVIPKYYKIQTINQYGVNENEIYYIFTNFCGNVYRIVKFNDGRINLEIATEGNPVPQEDLAEAWEHYLEDSQDA